MTRYGADTPDPWFVEFAYDVERFMQDLPIEIAVAAERTISLARGAIGDRQHRIDLNDNFWFSAPSI